MKIENLDYIINALQDRTNELISKNYEPIKYEINMLNQRLIYLRRRYQSTNVLCNNEGLDGQEECYKLSEMTSKLIEYSKELNVISKELGILFLKYNVHSKIDKEDKDAK